MSLKGRNRSLGHDFVFLLFQSNTIKNFEFFGKYKKDYRKMYEKIKPSGKITLKQISRLIQISITFTQILLFETQNFKIFQKIHFI